MAVSEDDLFAQLEYVGMSRGMVEKYSADELVARCPDLRTREEVSVVTIALLAMRVTEGMEPRVWAIGIVPETVLFDSSLWEW
jgi:hypothetical protein